MDILWSTWRSQYIQTFKDEAETSEGVENNCFFCDAVCRKGSDKDLLVVYRGESAFVILNRYPYNGGHLLIAPYRHIGDLDQLSDSEMTEIMMLIRKSTRVLSLVSSPHGFNIGSNIGRVAGAGVPGHIHFHVVPRWSGDTNFMSVISDTKVVSQSLEESWKLISDNFAKG